MTFSSFGYGYTEIPPTRVVVNISNKTNETDFQPGVALGVFSDPGRLLSFRVLLDNGAMISKIPIHKVAPYGVIPSFIPSEVQIWDCLSYGISCHVISHVHKCHVQVCKNNVEICGKYLFTICFWGEGTYATSGGDIGYKDLHIIETSYGYLAFPNTNISWHEKSHVTPFSWSDPPKIETFEEVPCI